MKRFLFSTSATILYKCRFYIPLSLVIKGQFAHLPSGLSSCPYLMKTSLWEKRSQE